MTDQSPWREERSNAVAETTRARSDTVERSVRERFELLEPERRRLALAVLEKRSSRLDLADLAADVAERERGSDATVREVRIDLHHAHLPKLAAAGVVDYDPATHTVAPTAGDSETVDDLATAVRDTSPLAVELRRRVLEYFDAATCRTASLDDLARYAVMRLDGSRDLSADRIRIRLHHVDLPKLAAADLIDYERQLVTVRTPENFE